MTPLAYAEKLPEPTIAQLLRAAESAPASPYRPSAAPVESRGDALPAMAPVGAALAALDADDSFSAADRNGRGAAAQGSSGEVDFFDSLTAELHGAADAGGEDAAAAGSQAAVRVPPPQPLLSRLSPKPRSHSPLALGVESAPRAPQPPQPVGRLLRETSSAGVSYSSDSEV